MKAILIAYSGHSYVVYDILIAMGYNVLSYCDQQKKEINPYRLKYLGSETETRVQQKIKECSYFIAVGDNKIRQNVHQNLKEKIQAPINAIHPSAVISPSTRLGEGILIASNVTINSQVSIGNGVICNTACIVEHECIIGPFAHIAPGAVLAGNVTIGERTFVGANSVIKQGISIGKDVIIGAGTVVINDISDNCTVVGNPERLIKK